MSENAYQEAVGNATYYPGASSDPVRANAPYTPVTLVNAAGAPSVPILGVAVVAGIVLWFEHMRRTRGGRRRR